jgi:hypothetical protein
VKIPELKLALEGHFSEHHRFLVEHLLGHLDELERHVEEISSRIAEQLSVVLPRAARLYHYSIAPPDARADTAPTSFGAGAGAWPFTFPASAWSSETGCEKINRLGDGLVSGFGSGASCTRRIQATSLSYSFPVRLARVRMWAATFR